MSYAVKLTDTEIQAIADDVLGREMRDLAFERAEVRSGVDDEDMPSLAVSAKVGPNIAPLKGEEFSRIHGALHEALLARGEERFPFFRLRREDDEVPADDRDEIRR